MSMIYYEPLVTLTKDSKGSLTIELHFRGASLWPVEHEEHRCLLNREEWDELKGLVEDMLEGEKK